MLLKSISAVNSRGHVLNLPLNDPSGGFSVRDIQGLGPVKAEVRSSPFAQLDGEQYHSSRRGPRNIVAELGLNPDYGQQSVYSLRTQLYAYFMPKSEIKLKFELYDKFTDTTLNVEIDGVVESAEPSIFAKDPNIVISVLCHNPDFVDPNLITVNLTTQGSAIYTDIDYQGTVETGFLLSFMADRDLISGGNYAFNTAMTRPDGIVESLAYYEQILNGETIEISSVRGNKYVHLVGGGLPDSKIYALADGSAWFELYPGVSQFLTFAYGMAVGVPYKIEYYNRYGGI